MVSSHVSRDRSTVARRDVLAGVVGLSLLVLAACGGTSSGSDGSSERSPERTTTTQRTTTTEAAKADAATAAASAAKVFELGDLPEGWTVATEAPPYATKGLKIDECSNPADGPLAALPLGAIVGGPTLKAPDVDYYLTTWAATFPTEEDATTYAESRNTADAGLCQAEALEAANGKGTQDFSVEPLLQPDAANGVGQDHRVAAQRFEFRQGEQVTSTMAIDTYQLGTTVVTVQVQLGPMSQAEADAAGAVEAEVRGNAFGG